MSLLGFLAWSQVHIWERVRNWRVKSMEKKRLQSNQRLQRLPKTSRFINFSCCSSTGLTEANSGSCDCSTDTWTKGESHKNSTRYSWQWWLYTYLHLSAKHFKQKASYQKHSIVLQEGGKKSRKSQKWELHWFHGPRKKFQRSTCRTGRHLVCSTASLHIYHQNKTSFLKARLLEPSQEHSKLSHETSPK